MLRLLGKSFQLESFSRFGSLLMSYARYGLVAAIAVECAAPAALRAATEDITLKYIKPVGFKLTSARTVWIDNSSVPIHYQYRVPKYKKDAPAPPELVKRMEDDAKNLIAMLRTQLSPNLLTSLEKAGVQRGDEYTIELKPTSVDHVGNNIGMRVFITVRVMNQMGEKVWSTVVHASRGYNLIGIDFTNQDNTYIENTIEMLLAQMRKAEMLM